MINNWYKKPLVVGIIVLFIGVSALPIVSSKSVSSPIEMLLEHGVESVDNDEIESLDGYDEIISYISGLGYILEDSGIWLLFYRRNLHMNQGHFSIISITKNPAERIVKREASSVRIPHFFGILYHVGGHYGEVLGFGLGNL